MEESKGLLGDTASRDYSEKLKLFNAYAAPELKQAIAELHLPAGAAVLDAGCGTGDALPWLHAAVQPGGSVLGIDLSLSHVESARRVAGPGITVRQGDLAAARLPPASFELIWSCNAINHVRDPLSAVQSLKRLLRDRGRLALGQSSLLPDMFFSWDARLERVTNEAVRRYYRERYQLTEASLTAIRGILGLVKRAGFSRVTARSMLIERISPLDPATEHYLQRVIFEGTFRGRLRGYLDEPDYEALSRLTDPSHAEYALHRSDFHFLQTFTLITGEV